MQHRLRSIVLALALIASTAWGQKKSFDILHSFTGADGNLPTWVIQTKAGEVWGVTNSGGGGTPGGGMLYKISATGVYSIVHTFTDKPDGAMPGKLIQAADGSIYGVTALGGTSSAGTIYRVDTAGQYQVLHSFNGLSDGKTPNFLTQTNDGAIYGTASFFGMPIANGTLFKIDVAGNFAALHTFQEGIDGSNPNSVMQAADGLLYGTCRQDGPLGVGLGLGTFWRSDLAGNVVLLHVFEPKTLTGNQPTEPVGVVPAADGFFYGAANKGGQASNGAIFQADATGRVTTLHSFDASAPDGAKPDTNFNLGSDGFFFGTLGGGGLPVSNSLRSGVVYRADTAGRTWVLHTFTGGDGGVPFAPAYLGSRGTVFSTAQFQGPLGHGVTTSLSVAKNLPIASLTFAPNPVTSGQSVNATITLSRPAGERGQVVSLFTTPLLGAPATVTVPARQLTVSFTVTTLRKDFPSNQSVTASIGSLGITAPLDLVP